MSHMGMGLSMDDHSHPYGHDLFLSGMNLFVYTIFFFFIVELCISKETCAKMRIKTLDYNSITKRD